MRTGAPARQVSVGRCEFAITQESRRLNSFWTAA
jgi:hypothetical protein